MTESLKKPGLQADDKAIYDISELIAGRTGILIHPHQTDKLKSTVLNTCRHFHYSNPGQLLEVLQSSDHSIEQEQLIAGITVGESYFFRDDTQIKFIREHWLPRLIGHRRKLGLKMIRVWSAGCSAGQELYTLAILLHELIEDIDDWHIHLLGTDINTSALSQSVQGIYTDWSFRNTPPDIRNKYFSRYQNKFRIIPEIRNNVKFSYLNLVDDGYPSAFTETVAIDLILCRNVFIYFESSRVASILERFSECLVTDGIIVLGASDIVDRLPENLALKMNMGALYYNYLGHVSRQQAVKKIKRPEMLSKQPARNLRKTLRVNPDWKHQAAKSGTDRPDTDKTCPAPTRADLQLLSQKNDWQSILQATQACQDDEKIAAVYRAWALANAGELPTAKGLIQSCIDDCQTLPEAHFVYGMVLMDLDQTADAEHAFKKAVFLERNFPEAHYRLGLVQLSDGKHQAGVKSLMNARSLVTKSSQDTIFSMTMTADSLQRFAQVLTSELDIYSELQSDRKGPGPASQGIQETAGIQDKYGLESFKV